MPCSILNRARHARKFESHEAVKAKKGFNLIRILWAHFENSPNRDARLFCRSVAPAVLDGFPRPAKEAELR